LVGFLIFRAYFKKFQTKYSNIGAKMEGKIRNGYKAKPRRQLRKREPRKFEKGRESIARNDP